jgi:hypothetical protein
VEIAPIVRPSPEIKLREVVPMERAPVVVAPIENVPVQAPRRERLKLQIVPTGH